MSFLSKNSMQKLQAIILMAVMVFSVFAKPSFGAALLNSTVSLSNHTVNALADHSYKFRTPTGVDSPTDTITINLSSWVTGATNFNDIDLLHGPVTGLETNNTLAAVPGVNIWGASFAGGILTLTPPTNAAPGTINPNDYVTIYIGTNATGGVNQLTNPAVAGSYTITIAGGFGDMGQVAQAIMTNSGVSVGGTVASSLQITNLNPSSVVAGSGAFNMTITGLGFVSSSIARIDGADRPTIFVSSTQLSVSILASDVLTASTKQMTVHNPIPGITSNQLPLTITSPSTPGGGTTDTTPPIILNPQAINITQTSARIIWDTDEPATSIVQYGITDSYGNTVSNGSLVLSHGIDLSGLTPNTVYHFRVTSADQYGNSATSADYTFTTLPWPPLEIYNVTSTNITDTSAIIIWDTNRAANSRVEYGLTAGLGMHTNQSGYVSNHAVPLTSLTLNTLYYYRVISYDINGIGATSTIYTFRTTSDQTPPTNINLTATPGDTIVNLVWTHPPEPDFAGVRLIRKLGSFPTGPYDGVLVYDGLALSTVDTGLTNGVTYYYGAYAYDFSGNFASGALDDAMPFGDIPVTPTSTTTTPPLPPPPTTTPPLPPPSTTTPPLPPTTTTTPPTLPTTIQITPIYYGANGTLLLEPDASGVYGVLSGETVLVRVSVAALGEQAQTAFIIVNGQTYSLALSANGTEFTGTFPAPESGLFFSDVRVTFVSGATAEAEDIFQVQNPGEVVAAEIIAGITPVPGATVTLYQIINGQTVVWNGAPYGQVNPALSDENGNFVFRVPNGVYYVEVAKVGYDLQRSSLITVERNVFGDRVELITIPRPLFINTCKIDCSKVSYSITITDQIGQSRTTGGDYSYSQDLAGGTILYSFTEQAGISTANDVYVQVDDSNCENLKFSITKINPSISHAVSVSIFYDGEFLRSYAITTDSRQALGRTLAVDLTNNPELCEEEVEQVLQIEAIPEAVEYAILTTLDTIRIPEVVTITDDWIVPTLLGVSLINLGGALGLINLLAYLQYLFAQPILLFGKLRKRRWGVVYNSLSKQPVELAVVRLMHFESKLIVQTKVTDKEGRFYFRAKKGHYYIEVVKPQYEFPTVFLSKKKEDAVYTDLYHGENINLEEDGIIAVNIPVDPAQIVDTPRKVLYRRFLKRVQHIIALSGVILAAVALIISPTAFVAMVLVLQILFYFLFRQLALPAKARSWGRVYDAKTKKAINGAVVRIFDKQFNKLLETQATSSNGKYGFFAEHNTYYITVEKEGYQKHSSGDLDLKSRRETVVDLDIPLVRELPPKA
jgi:hypothetical protein